MLKPDGLPYTKQDGGSGWFRLWFFWKATGSCSQPEEGDVAIGFYRTRNSTTKLAEDKYHDMLDELNNNKVRSSVVTLHADMIARATITSSCPGRVSLQLGSKIHTARKVRINYFSRDYCA